MKVRTVDVIGALIATGMPLAGVGLGLHILLAWGISAFVFLLVACMGNAYKERS